MVYDSIDNLPIWNYNKILETGEYKPYGVKTEKIFDSIQEEFFNKIGYSDKYFTLLRKKIELVKLKCDYYLRGKKSSKTFAKVLEVEIEEMQKGEHVTFEELVAMISKYMQFRIDPKVVTVSEFYSYYKIAEKHG